MVEFKLEQKATSLPAKNVVGEVKVVEQFGTFILIRLPHFWIRLDLSDNTYAIGAYEG